MSKQNYYKKNFKMQISRHIQCLAIASMLLLGSTTRPAAGLTIEVAQESNPGAGDFDGNVVGSIQSYSTTLTAEAFYGWDTQDFSFDPPVSVPTVDNQSSVFFVETSEGLTLFHVHDDKTSAVGGSAANTWEFPGDTADFLARDDANGDDTFLGGGGSTLAVQNFTWLARRSDGAAIGPLVGVWTALVSFHSFTGLDSWIALSADGSSVALALENDRRIRLRPACGSGLVGDLNCDGFVGAGDLDILLGVWNQNVGGGALADLNADGFIGAGDLDILLGNWNAGTPPGAAAAVPEPGAAAALAGLGLAMLTRRRWRA